MWLMGDFNSWNKFEHPLKKLEYGKWELKLSPKTNGECQVEHLSKLKLVIKGPDPSFTLCVSCGSILWPYPRPIKL